MWSSISWLLQPCYLFSPATLVRRIWLKLFRPKKGLERVRLPWGSEMRVNVEDAIGGAIYNQRIFDIGVSETAWRLLQLGDKVLDAGANVGYMSSLFASRVGPDGVIHSFEPHPQIREMLCANVLYSSKNPKASPIVVHDLALSDESGCQALIESNYFSFNQGTASLVPSGDTFSKSYSVEVSTLDDLFPNESFGLLKIDVEGFELNVIKGARKMLHAHRVKHVIYEDHTLGSSGLPQMFETAGYSVFSIGHTLHGLELRSASQQIAIDTTKESASYLATCDPNALDRYIGKGWKVLGARS